MYQYFLLRQSNGDIFGLDSTTKIRVTYPGKLSETIIGSKKTVSDNYVVGNPTVDFSGLISTAKSSLGFGNKDTKKPEDYIEGLKQIRKGKEPFTLYHISEDSVLQDCYFSNLSFEQDSTYGKAGINSASVKVEFTAKQVRFSEVTEIEVVPSPPEFDAQTDKVTTQGITTETPESESYVESLKKELEKTKEKRKRLFNTETSFLSL